MAATYPVHVEGRLDPGLSRWLWLVKWVLAIPHLVVLAFLWIAFLTLSVAAFFAILVTGRYPRTIFDVNVGILRWTWRVGYYTYGALGTDRYPPFSLAAEPDYPATLDIAYPEHLSRGLVLVKWWLLALPHYLVLAILVGGGGGVLAWESENWRFSGGSLLTLLVLVGAVVLLFTGRYPQGVFDLALGINRWWLRVAAYAGLMTDQYPPFRLDMGGPDPTSPAPLGGSPGPASPAPALAPAPAARSGWGAGAVISVVVGVLVGFTALGIGAAGGALLWADRTQRDDAGFVTADSRELTTPTYAISSEGLDVVYDGPVGFDWGRVAGEVRLDASGSGDQGVFVGIGPQEAVEAYLAGVSHARVTRIGDRPAGASMEERPGDRAPADPATQDFWVASASGPGTQSITWTPTEGRWAAVVLNADAAPGVSAEVAAAAEAPWLLPLALALLVAAVMLLGAAMALVLLPAVQASRP